ncbi:MAG: adenosine deaminase [Salaquimonas sp.]
MPKSLIKAELHCHIEGAAEPGLVLKQAQKYNVDASPYVALEQGYLWSDFSSFLKSYDFVASLFKTPEDYVLLSETHYKHIASQNAIYGEVFISSDHAARIGCSYGTLIDAVSEGIYRAKSATGIEGRIVATGVRHAGIEAVNEAAKLAANEPHPLVTGFGIAGDERMFEPADFAYAFDIVRDAGLQTTAHAGEFGGPESVREALDHLKVSRIGHGVRSIEDLDLVKRIADEGIVLEICPASNVVLNVYNCIEDHPLRKLDEAGCIVTLSSDDPPHFHTSLQNEYDIAREIFGYDDNALNRFTKNALEHAFVDGETRKQMLEKLAQATID